VLLEAVTAIDWPVVPRLEWDLGLLTTICTRGRIHLAWCAVSVAATSAGGRFASSAALWAAARLIRQATASVKLLLAYSKHKGLAAVAALEGHIGRHERDLSHMRVACRSGYSGNHEQR
jgi:hypothetical protein